MPNRQSNVAWGVSALLRRPLDSRCRYVVAVGTSWLTLRQADLPAALIATLVEAGDRLVNSMDSALAVLAEQARARTS
jgi:hypothetical protein